jgi:hypothetical protein
MSSHLSEMSLELTSLNHFVYFPSRRDPIALLPL